MATAESKGLFRGAGWMLSSGGLQAGVAFAANLALVRAIAPEDFGRFALALASIGLVLAVGSLRLKSVVIRLGERDLDEEGRRLYFSAIVLEALGASVVALLWLLACRLLSLESLLLCAAVMLDHLAHNLKGFYERKLPYKRLAFAESVTQLAGHGLAVLFAYGGLGALTLYVREALFAVGSLTGLAVLGGLELHRVRLLHLDEWRAVARRSRGLWADGVLESGFARVLVLCAGWVGGTAGAGFFFQAQRLARTPHQLLAPLSARMAYNAFSLQGDRAARRRARRRLMWLCAVPSVLAAVPCLFAADIVPWLFGERWAPAAPLLAALSGFVLAASLFAVLKMYLLASHQTRLLLPVRAVQYAALGATVLAASEGAGVLAVALGLSLATVLAVVTGLVVLRVRESRPRAASTMRASEAST